MWRATGESFLIVRKLIADWLAAVSDVDHHSDSDVTV